jgi:predicted nuclease of predicted toxin-antitoxin system
VRIVVDENIPGRTVVALRALGHDVIDARESECRGKDDTVLWDFTQRARALLVTTDKGFASLWDQPHSGILIVRLRRPNREKIHERVMTAIGEVAPADWPGLLLVLRDRVRSERRFRPEHER